MYKKLCIFILHYYITINIIAIVNYKNDISMFKITKISVAIKNAAKEEKTFAKVTTKINDKDAVAYYLNSL